MSLIPISMRLKSSDPEKRLAAVKELAASSDASNGDALVGALGDASFNVRNVAIKALVERGDDRVVDTIAAQLREKSPAAAARSGQLARNSREARQNELGVMLVRVRSPRAIDALIGALNDDDSTINAIARRCLVEIGHVRALPALLVSGFSVAEAAKTWPDWLKTTATRTAVVDALDLALLDADAAVRARAAAALGDIHDDRATQLLIRTVSNTNERLVCWAAADALVKHNAVQAIEPLAALLRADGCSPALARALDALGWRPTDAADRAALAVSFGRWPEVAELGAAAVGALVRGLELRQFEFGQTEMAIRALRDARDVRAVDVLLAEVISDGVCAIDAAAALGAIGDPRAIAALAQATRSKQPILRTTAARALGGFDDQQARDALIAALKSPDADLRIAAAAGLSGAGAVRDHRIRQPLMDALNDANIAVVGAVARALGRAGAAAAAAPLMGFARVPPIAAPAVDALRDLLAQSAADIDDDTLRMLSRFRLKDIDTSDIRRLVDAELARRHPPGVTSGQTVH